ncbi:MAG: transporter [Thermoleophilia bacterium]|nr:transporter [Thermoleophilia bacterium]
MTEPRHGIRRQIVATLAAFATFGSFWGAWGASIPRIRDQAGVDDGELGLALLCIGAGALPAMLLFGRALDRYGLRVTAYAIAALGCTGVLVTLGAQSFMTLASGLVVVGMASGAADVGMNAVAGRAEQDAGRPVITKAHGMLSGFVVIGSLAAAGVAALDLPLVLPFVAVAAMSVVALAMLLRAIPPGDAETTDTPIDDGVRVGLRGAATVPLLLVGVLGALAFATESAPQNWSAVFARDVLDAGNGQAALAPAFYAMVVSGSRLSIGSLGAAHAQLVLVSGAVAAAIGSLVVSASQGPVMFVVGLAIAAAGTAVLFPTVLGIVSRTVLEDRRGRATSLVTTVSYLGFLLAPAYVGAWAEAFDLRVAMVAVAALAGTLAALTPILMRLATSR